MDAKLQPFVDKYKEEAIKRLESFAGRKLNMIEISRIDDLIEKTYTDRPAYIVNSIHDKRVTTSVGALLSWIPNRKGGAILTGYGTIFKPHSEYHSTIGDLVDFLLKNRKVLKNKMFDMIRAGRDSDDPEVRAMDVGQKLFKLLANSFYGATGEKGFMFYNPDMGPATTYTGQLIISSTMFGFESFLTGNLWLRNPAEMARHITQCLTDIGDSDIQAEWGEHPDFVNVLTPEYAIESLVNNSAPGWKSREYATQVVSLMTTKQLAAIALRGDPYTFLTFPKAYEAISTALSGEIREADPGKIGKHHPEGKIALDALAEGMKKWVAVSWMPNDLMNIVTHMKRRAVMIVDTDSNFLNLHPWMNWLDACVDGFNTADEDQRLTGLNTMVYILRLMNDYQMGMLTKHMGVPEDKRSIINFKSEFVIKRIVITEGKKNYAGLLTFQEGARINGGKAEFKGLSMRKSTVARSTGKYLEKSVEDNILRAETVNRGEFLKDIVRLEETIRQNMSEGGLIYATPATVGNISTYADKFSMPVVRGMYAWNAFNDDNEIREGARVHLFRVNVNTDATKLTNAMAAYEEGTFEHNALMDLTELFFSATAEEGLAKNGFNWLAVPRNESAIPLFLRQFIDTESVITANTSPSFPILEAVGLRVVRSDPEMYSNVIRF